MSWKDILKELSPRERMDAEDFAPEEMKEGIQSQYYLTLESITSHGWDMPDLDEQEFFTGTLEEAKKWAEKKFDNYSDSNEGTYRVWGGSFFKLYDEDDNLVHSNDNY